MKTIGSGILSWIKHAVQEYSEELYQSMYHEKDPIKKTFCFAPILPKPKFDNNQIELSGIIFKLFFLSTTITMPFVSITVLLVNYIKNFI